MVEKKLLGDLKTMVATMLKFPSGRLDENADLGDLGVDSISMMRIMREISERFDVELSPARMVTADTLAQLSSVILTDHPEQLKRYYGAGSPPAVASKAEPPAAAESVEPAPAAREERAWEQALRRLSEKYDVDLSSALPRAGDAEAIVRVLRDRFRDQMVSHYGARERRAAGMEAIAIVGMSVRFPQAPDTRAFWRNLMEGRSAIGEVPASRWDWRPFYSEERTPGKTISKWGAFIEGADRFDPLFFRISPKEAALIDPQERLILQEGYRALEDAGLDVDALAGSKTAVFVGFELTDYLAHLQAQGVALGAAAPTYNLANRLSYCFDFRGPSEAINVNCASSALAIHRAVQSLSSRESDLALAGGVCLHLLPQSQVAADDFLSPDGSCRVFDERANGFTRGEGCGVVVLKRLADAQRDGDRIYALIKASAQNNRGRSKSMSDIRGEALTEVIRTCLERAQVEPESLRYVEVDGYCTKWGDAIEYEAIKSVFSGVDHAGSPGKTCGLGSLKGNVGHLEPASGVAGVVKLALALWHRRFPPTVTFEEVNEYVDVAKETHPLYLMGEARSFDDLEGPAGRPVRAGVNSFADSGVNVHILLEEWPQPAAAETRDAGPCLVVLSAQTRERLEASAARLLAFLRETPPEAPSLGDLAYSLQVGRRAMAARLALVVADRSALIEGLQSFLAPSAEGRFGVVLYVGPQARESSILSEFLEGETGETVVSLLVAEGKLEKLALLWSQGVSIPWARLYTDKKYAGKEYRKISLPGYPFEERRCWLGPAAAEPEPGAPTPPTGGGVRGLLTRLVATTLGIPAEAVAPDTPLQDLGLHSLALVEVVRALEEQLGISLSHREVLEHTTIAALTRLLKSKLGREAVAAPARQIHAAAEPYPLSEGQQGLWLLQEIEPGMSAYNLPVALRMDGEVDRDVLRRAIAAVLDQHPALRSVVRCDAEGIPWQSVDDALEMPWTETSIASFADDEVRSLLEAAFKEPFATEGGLFVRAHLFSRSATSHVLLFTVHHLVFDGTSAVRLVNDLLAAYTALARGEAWLPSHAEGTASYRDFVAWEQTMLDGPAGRAHLAYWQTQLAGELPKLEWLADKPRPVQQTYRGASWSTQLAPELTNALRKLAREQGVSLFVLLLGLYKVLLHRYTSQQDLVVGVPTAGRSEKRFAHTVGYFVNMVALRSSVTGGRAFSDFLDALKWTVVDGLDHAAYPFPRLVRELGIRPEASSSPIFQTAFVLQSYVAGDAERALAERFPGFSILEDLHTGGWVDVRLEVVEKEQRLFLDVAYNPDLYTEDTLRRLTAHYATLAESAIKHPACPIAELDLLSDAERRMIAGWNDTRRDDLSGGSLPESIAAQAERRPDAVALRCGDRALTYGELCRQTGRLARGLRGLGVGADVLVGVSMGRSLEMVLGMLGVLEAGGAYVLLDPELPNERLSFLVADTRLGIVLTCSALAERLKRCAGESTRRILLDDAWEASGEPEAEQDPPVPRVAPGQLAYVAFTSGSTGVPKGVMVEHGNLLSYTLALLDRIDFASIETVAQVSTFYADLGYTVLYPGLAAGKTVCIAEEEQLWDGERFGGFLADHAVEAVKMTPSHFFSLTRGLPPPWQLKILILGGESMKAEEVERVFEELPETRLYNHYGPTETTVGATVWELSESTWDRRNRIGKPLANVSVHVLDDRLEPVPVGVPGELWIGGRGVARGYLDRPAQTAEAFVERAGERVYRTGDRARWLPDGSLEYLGRRDLQVKIRGYRVELGEVESVLAEHPEIREVAVVGKERHGTQQLVAYYATKNGAPLDAETLRKTLGERLPSYMVPAVFVELEAIALDANGKVDRRRLVERDLATAARGPIAAPRSAIEQQLALLWQEILQVEEVGRHDNFFALGGDSMIAIRFFTKARRAGLRLRARDVFRYQTLAELAARCAHDEAGVAFAELVHLNQVDSGPPVFWLHGGMGGVEAYWAIAERVARPFYGLQARGLVSAEAPLQGIEAMAAHYVRILRSVQPEGAYDLGGYSFGGILAYEITRQLQEQGRTVASVVLVDSSDVESLKRRERAGSSKRESYLRAVNAALQNLVQRPEDVVKILIHRDELDAGLDDEAFLTRLLTLARARGLKKTRRQVRTLVEDSERIQQGYGIASYSLRPLPRPETVRGYYLRNQSGAFLGVFEPYFSLSQDPAPASPGNYWRGWEEHLPNLSIRDVESSSHVTMLSEAASREHVLSFCAALYAGETHAPAQRPRPVGERG